MANRLDVTNLVLYQYLLGCSRLICSTHVHYTEDTAMCLTQYKHA